MTERISLTTLCYKSQGDVKSDQGPCSVGEGKCSLVIAREACQGQHSLGLRNWGRGNGESLETNYIIFL